MKLKTARESVGWMNSEGPLTVGPSFTEPLVIHHGRCPKALAWDIPDVPCECPNGWPKKPQGKRGPTRGENR